MKVELVDHIDLNEVYQYLQSPEAGAINLFIGTVRNHGQGKAVTKLLYEAYDAMACDQMRQLAAQANEKWPLLKVLIIHAIGEKMVGEPVVVIGVAAAHRHVSFEACRYLIDTLKQGVPIWKKEFYEDSSSWVNAHP